MLRLEITILDKWKFKQEKITKSLKKHPSKGSRTGTTSALMQLIVEAWVRATEAGAAINQAERVDVIKAILRVWERKIQSATLIAAKVAVAVQGGKTDVDALLSEGVEVEVAIEVILRAKGYVKSHHRNLSQDLSHDQIALDLLRANDGSMINMSEIGIISQNAVTILIKILVVTTMKEITIEAATDVIMSADQTMTVTMIREIDIDRDRVTSSGGIDLPWKKIITATEILPKKDLCAGGKKKTTTLQISSYSKKLEFPKSISLIRKRRKQATPYRCTKELRGCQARNANRDGKATSSKAKAKIRSQRNRSGSMTNSTSRMTEKRERVIIQMKEIGDVADE